jgi:hypothetical protein
MPTCCWALREALSHRRAGPEQVNQQIACMVQQVHFRDCIPSAVNLTLAGAVVHADTAVGYALR